MKKRLIGIGAAWVLALGCWVLWLSPQLHEITQVKQEVGRLRHSVRAVKIDQSTHFWNETALYPWLMQATQMWGLTLEVVKGEVLGVRLEVMGPTSGILQLLQQLHASKVTELTLHITGRKMQLNLLLSAIIPPQAMIMQKDNLELDQAHEIQNGVIGRVTRQGKVYCVVSEQGHVSFRPLENSIC